MCSLEMEVFRQRYGRTVFYERDGSQFNPPFNETKYFTDTWLICILIVRSMVSSLFTCSGTEYATVCSTLMSEQAVHMQSL